MGIFPIAMNILQFWLIDSIVKASSTTSPLTLETDADGADREPLFRGSMDDEDDDNDDGPGRDIENRRHRVRSPSRSPARSRDRQKSSSSTSLTTPFENKSSGSSTTSQAMELRELAASTSHSSSDSVSSLSGRRTTKRRSPPAPLHIPLSSQPAINSPQRSAHGSLPKPSITTWADSWQDSDDWATRVGEEDWTGRRLELKKHSLLGGWEFTAPSIQVGS